MNFKADVFAYYVNQANDEKFISFSAEIKNEEKFAEFIEDILTKSEINLTLKKRRIIVIHSWKMMPQLVGMRTRLCY